MGHLFETESCSRCGGSGKYSWCQAHLDVCFKCGGRGIVLTKRGRVAQDFFRDSMLIPVSEVKAGDVVLDLGKKIKVIGVSPDTLNVGRTNIKSDKIVLGLFSDSTITLVPSPEKRKVLADAALEVQSKLTKQGKLMKKYQTA